MTESADIVVVGGGPVGAALALALSAAGRAPIVIEPQAPGAGALRPVALSHGSRLILERLDAWDSMAPATPITRIHVSQRLGFGRAALTARDVGLPALGYVVDYGCVHAALDQLATGRVGGGVVRGAVTRVVAGHDAATVEYVRDQSIATLQARLVVVADGGALRDQFPARVVDYRQTAVAALVAAEQRPEGTAYERFTAGGPLALLPHGDEHALVWCVAPERAGILCALGEAEFAAELAREFGEKLGKFRSVAQRAAYPLALRVADDSRSPRVLLVGNAAQTLHPVAGQGLNLGLRDAWELAGVVTRVPPRDAGGNAMLTAYRARRRVDRRGGIGFTDSLVRGFSNDHGPLSLARGLALTALGCAPPLRDFMVRRMTFGSRG